MNALARDLKGSTALALINHAGRGHSEWGASGASRWMSCAGSVYWLRQFPPRPSGPAAAEGTWAHECLEKLLSGEYSGLYTFMDGTEGAVTPESFKESILEAHPNAIVYRDKEMERCVGEVAEWVQQKLAENPGAILFLEKPFEITEEVWGTNDVAIYAPLTGTLYVMDFKYGKGVVVEVKGNKQLRIYALGIIKDLEAAGHVIRHVEITICQPRADHTDGTIRSEEVGLIDLFDFSLEVERAVKRTKIAMAELSVVPPSLWESEGLLDAYFKPSREACRWCVSATCPAAQRDALKDLPDVSGLEDLAVWEPPTPGTLDLPALVAITLSASKIKKWLSSVHAHVMEAGLRGADLGEAKVVVASNRRKFLDNTEAVLEGLDKISNKVLDRSVFCNTRLKGLGDVEDLLLTLPDEVLSQYGKNKTERKKNIKMAMAELMEKKEGKTYTIVPLNDKRDAVKLDPFAEIDFSAIDDFEDAE